MQARGGGAIVNQSSTAAWLYSGFYGLAKVGINGLTQQLAHELGGMDIRVNAIAPGPTDTEATRTQAGDAASELVKGLALKRMGQPEDMVGACLFLLSDEASWLTGQIVNVDGGQVFQVTAARLRRARQHRQADGAPARRVARRPGRVRRRRRRRWPSSAQPGPTVAASVAEVAAGVRRGVGDGARRRPGARRWWPSCSRAARPGDAPSRSTRPSRPTCPARLADGGRSRTGVRVVDAPVSGGAMGAHDGTLGDHGRRRRRGVRGAAPSRSR